MSNSARRFAAVTGGSAGNRYDHAAVIWNGFRYLIAADEAEIQHAAETLRIHGARVVADPQSVR